MDTTLAEQLDELYRQGQNHDRAQADRLRRWRNVEPETARLMSVLIRARAPRRLLELGTSNVYSTIRLADAARAVGGSLTSVEIDPDRSARARQNLIRAELEPFVDLRVQDAAEFRELVANDDAVDEAVAPTGAGALLVVREPSR
jgi:predicted O-methyltransferase YrrM